MDPNQTLLGHSYCHKWLDNPIQKWTIHHSNCSNSDFFFLLVNRMSYCHRKQSHNTRFEGMRQTKERRPNAFQSPFPDQSLMVSWVRKHVMECPSDVCCKSENILIQPNSRKLVINTNTQVWTSHTQLLTQAQYGVYIVFKLKENGFVVSTECWVSGLSQPVICNVCTKKIAKKGCVTDTCGREWRPST